MVAGLGKPVVLRKETLVWAVQRDNPGLARSVAASVLREVFRDLAKDLAVEFAGDWPAQVSEPEDVVAQGTGLGPVLSEHEASARLDAITQPSNVGSWAGSMLRPSAMARHLNVSRSTLDSWRHAGLVVAIPFGRVAHQYPVGQFPDMRPLPGINDVIEAAGDNGALAWRWLTTPHSAFGGATPLSRLVADRTDGASAVAAAALDDLA